MQGDAPDLAALIGSRICHDLVGPLGAVGNGVELLHATGQSLPPEMALITESVATAQGRIALFRVAFGAAAADQRVDAATRREVSAGLTAGGRLQIDWQPAGPLPRPAAKLAALLMLCAETALPRGGTIRVAHHGTGLRLRAEGAKVSVEPQLWALLHAQELPGELRAAQVQFPLAARELALQGRIAEIETTPQALRLSC